MSLLTTIVNKLIRRGSLTITEPDGTSTRFGDGTGEHVHAEIKTPAAARAIALDPSLALPEAFMNGTFVMREGDIHDFLHVAFSNLGREGTHPTASRLIEGWRKLFRRFQQINTAGRAKENVHRHYDLSGELYRLFLDEDMQYSCAYFERPDMTLAEAQEAKKRHLAAKLDMKPGLSVLDIGSGWGGLGLYLARNFDADVLGVTLSTEQHSVATERARQVGLENHVHFELRDYRDLKERFDRIVSVGMFEHVGVNHYKTFFNRAATLLKPDGTMVLHTIGRSGPPSVTNAFIRKYIFPGGYIPALSEVMPAVERSGLVVTDIEVLRLHYAETLKHWRQRFLANRKRAVEIYDERFARMWEFYLAASEASFRWQDLVVFQLQLTKRNDVLPITRGYIAEAEDALRKAAAPASGARQSSAKPGGAKRKKASSGRA
ncbi:MAG: class I SAM-dependent methyltransferase [Rhizobiaceae bacterium]|nr:class I SAM-dependent methyltransferase [Rhizobiaceae bacterium]